MMDWSANAADWVSAARQHYESVWGAGGQLRRIDLGPVERLPPGFAVLEKPPAGNRQSWSYGTCGMALASDETRIELHMFSPFQTDEIVELLFMTAHFHRTGARLGLHHTVNFGRPWLRGSTCAFGMISLPYIDGPRLEDGVVLSQLTKFYWLLPITEAERQYKIDHGTEALETKFDEVSLDYTNHLRAGVV